MSGDDCIHCGGDPFCAGGAELCQACRDRGVVLLSAQETPRPPRRSRPPALNRAEGERLWDEGAGGREGGTE